MPHVTQAEARVLVEPIRARGAYLSQLKQRMEKTGRPDDPLYPAVKSAYVAVHALWVHLHYRACGVDRPPESNAGTR